MLGKEVATSKCLPILKEMLNDENLNDVKLTLFPPELPNYLSETSPEPHIFFNFSKVVGQDLVISIKD